MHRWVLSTNGQQLIGVALVVILYVALVQAVSWLGIQWPVATALLAAVPISVLWLIRREASEGFPESAPLLTVRAKNPTRIHINDVDQISP